MTKFIDNTREGKKKEVKKTALTHYLSEDSGWVECDTGRVDSFKGCRVIYMGKCTIDGDIFMVKGDELMTQYKGTKGDEPFTDKYIDCSGEKPVEKPVEPVKVKTVFTECIDVYNMRICATICKPKDCAEVEYIGSQGTRDIFMAKLKDGGKCMFTGKKGDEFNS